MRNKIYKNIRHDDGAWVERCFLLGFNITIK